MNKNVFQIVREILEEFVCLLYGDRDTYDISDVRFQIFKQAKIPNPQRLPPTKDCMKLHFDRVNYQGLR